jgi:hypothetical protein
MIGQETRSDKEKAMHNMDLWVDPRVSQVRVIGVQRYLTARGWKPIPSLCPQLQVFEEPPGHGRERVVQSVPAREGGSGYKDDIVRVITNLAAIEDRYAIDVLNEILRL